MNKKSGKLQNSNTLLEKDLLQDKRDSCSFSFAKAYDNAIINNNQSPVDSITENTTEKLQNYRIILYDKNCRNDKVSVHLKNRGKYPEANQEQQFPKIGFYSKNIGLTGD